MIALFLLTAAPVTLGPSDPNFERYIKACQSDFERGLLETDEMLRTHKVPPPRQRFWSKLPLSEEQSAQAICAAWLVGMRYQLGKTKFVITNRK